VKFRVEINDGPLRAAMQATRRELNQEVKGALLRAAEDVTLPVAKQLAPVSSGALRASLIARATTRTVYLTTSLTKSSGARRVGLLEFGGTRRDVIVPRQRRALAFDGVFAARIATPRTYRAQQFMTRARDMTRGEVAERISNDVAAAIQAHIERHSPYPVK
jgi:HK97 gp10 family phage protein